MLFSDANKHKVVSTAPPQTVAKVTGFVVDPTTRSILAVTVKKAEEGDTLAWSDITGFGTDAVTVASGSLVTAADASVTALTGKEHEILGKRLLTARGDELGKVKDVEFDATTGMITAVVVDKDRHDASGLKGIGSYAVVLDLS